jgi:hypothetical protein
MTTTPTSPAPSTPATQTHQTRRSSTTWAGTLTATSSIAHGGETRGTITLLRRELIITPDGKPTHVPVISGNGFRGLLRRTGEEVLREALGYTGQLALPIAHALRSGGSLAKTSREPLSGRRLARLRELVPHIGVFGAAGGGRIVDGCLYVGKVVPLLAETSHIITPPPTDPLPAFNATQIETYVRQDDTNDHAAAELYATHVVDVDDTGEPNLDAAAIPDDDPASQLMMFRVETFPAGTRFATWLQLNHATDLEAAFFADVLDTYAAHARLGGRAAIGHGRVTLHLTRDHDDDPRERVDWRAQVAQRRDEALDALEGLQ